MNCFLRSKDTKNSGPLRGSSGVIRLSECNDEVENHLISCHISKESINKSELILARGGLFNLPQDKAGFSAKMHHLERSKNKKLSG